MNENAPQREWTLVQEALPAREQFVIANVYTENYIYAEILEYIREEDQWKYHNGQSLEEGRIVTAWQNGPSSYVGR